MFVQRPAAWPWPCDLKFNREHLLSTGNQLTKYCNSQRIGVKRYWANNIWDYRSSDQPKEQQQTNMPPIFQRKGGGGWINWGYWNHVHFVYSFTTPYNIRFLTVLPLPIISCFYEITESYSRFSKEIMDGIWRLPFKTIWIGDIT